MKRIVAVILAILMFATVGTAFAANEDFVLTIKGGYVAEHTENYKGTDCLRVDVLANSASESDKLLNLQFELHYDTAQLTAVDFEAPSKLGGTVNIRNKGEVLFAGASDTGCALTDNTVILTVWFKVADGLKNGTEIAFTMASAEAQAVRDGSMRNATVGSSFTPFKVGSSDTELPIVGDEATVEWNTEDVQFKGTTPYVIANGEAQTPRFTVKDSGGKVIDPANYTYEYKENTNAGTGYVFVTFQKGYSGETRGWFKIYLPATENTYVENRENGIYVKWDPVDGAAGYVIYRRAWSSTTNGWTSFERWNNTTGTSYLDGADDSHKVYAGTRYQYGVKAYFAKRTDPVSGATIGGNVGDNYNLGEVGPLKTTVRITTRKLVQVRTDREGQMTVKWEPSKNFTGYQIQYATDKAFTENVAAEKVNDPTSYWKSFVGLTSGATYYVRIRSYHEFEGMTYFGEWSNVLNVKVK